VNTIPETLESLTDHVAHHDEYFAANFGVPQMPISIHDHGNSKFGIAFGNTGLQEMDFQNTWSAINHLAVGWMNGYTLGSLR
jgi:hypothetical protein